MQLKFDGAELKDLVRDVVVEVISRLPIGGDSQPIYPHAEVAKMLGVSAYTLHEWRKDGRIRASQVGKSYAYTHADLMEFMAKNQEQ